jgi:hypothetical protein
VESAQKGKIYRLISDPSFITFVQNSFGYSSVSGPFSRSGTLWTL